MKLQCWESIERHFEHILWPRTSLFWILNFWKFFDFLKFLREFIWNWLQWLQKQLDWPKQWLWGPQAWSKRLKSKWVTDGPTDGQKKWLIESLHATKNEREKKRDWEDSFAHIFLSYDPRIILKRACKQYRVFPFGYGHALGKNDAVTPIMGCVSVSVYRRLSLRALALARYM